MLATVNGLPHLLRADANGVFHVHMHNPSAAPRIIARSEAVGAAEPLAALEFTSTDTALAAISSLSAPAPTYAEMAACAAAPTQLPNVGAKIGCHTRPTQWPSSAAAADVRSWLRSLVARSAHPSIAPAIADLLWEFRDCVSLSPNDLGRAAAIEHVIALRTQEPIFSKQFPLPAKHADAIHANIADWLRLGIIERTRSPYNSPIF